MDELERYEDLIETIWWSANICEVTQKTIDSFKWGYIK